MATKITAGTIVKVDTDGTGTPTATFTKVDGVKSIGGVGFTTDEIEATPIDSTTKEYVNGIKTPSSVEVVLFYDAADTMHSYLQADAIAGNIIPVSIEYTSGTTASFDAVVLGFEISGLDGNSPDAQTATLNFRISGDITWA